MYAMCFGEVKEENTSDTLRARLPCVIDAIVGMVTQSNKLRFTETVREAGATDCAVSPLSL